MERYYSVDHLKTLLNNILTTQVNNQEILDFVDFCQSQKEFDNTEQELLILEIYITLKQIDSFIPLITYSLDAIPEKIILHNFYSSEKKEKNIPTKVIKPEEKKEIEISLRPSNTAEKKFESEVEVSKENLAEEKIPMSEVKKRIIECYSPFTPEQNPTVQFPPPGEKYNLYIPNITIIPEKVYNAEVLIDSNGNIVDFLGDPIEQLNTDDYRDIYNGLVGQLFKFQETK